MKKLYYFTMILIFSCVVYNVYQLASHRPPSMAYKILNIVTPLVTLVYLITIIKRKKQLIKKLNEAIHKIFSKN